MSVLVLEFLALVRPLYLEGVIVVSESRESATLCCEGSDVVEDEPLSEFEMSWPPLPIIEGRIAVTMVALKDKSVCLPLERM